MIYIRGSGYTHANTLQSDTQKIRNGWQRKTTKDASINQRKAGEKLVLVNLLAISLSQ